MNTLNPFIEYLSVKEPLFTLTCFFNAISCEDMWYEVGVWLKYCDRNLNQRRFEIGKERKCRKRKENKQK